MKLFHQRLGMLYPSRAIVEEFIGLFSRRRGGWRDEGSEHLGIFGERSGEHRSRLYLNKKTGVVSLIVDPLSAGEHKATGWQALLDFDREIARELIEKNRRPIEITA